MNTVAFAALTVVILVMPWEDSVKVPAVGSVARLAGGIAALLGGAAILAHGTLRRPRAFHVLAVGFMLWSVLTLLWTIDPALSQDRVVTYIQVVALAWLIWEFAPTDSRQRTLLQAYVLGAYVPAVDTIRNWLAGSAWLKARFSASGFNPNEVAMVMVIGIPIAWYLALSARGRAAALLNFGYLPVAMFAVLLTASRGAFVASAVALMLIPWSLTRLSLRSQLGLVGLLIAFLAVAGAMVPEESRTRLSETATRIEEGDFGQRESIWAAGLNVVSEHPVRGVGAGAFARAVEPILGGQVSPHQTFLSVLAGQGLVGLTLFLSMLLAAFGLIPRMSGFQRKFWMVLALTLFIGMLPRTWDYSKPLWFVLSLLVAQSAHVRHRAPPWVSVEGRPVIGPEPDLTSSARARAHV